MIGLGLIILGCLSLFLGVRQLRDYRNGQNDFSTVETTGLHSLWAWTFKIRRFNAHLDIWIFLILGPALMIGGVVALLA